MSFSRKTTEYFEKLIQYRKDNNINYITPYTDENKPIKNSALRDWCKNW